MGTKASGMSILSKIEIGVSQRGGSWGEEGGSSRTIQIEGKVDSLGERGSYSGIWSRVDWLGFPERWRGLGQRIGGRYSRPVLVFPLLIIPVALMLEMDVRLVSAMLDMLEVGLCPLEDTEAAVDMEAVSKFIFLGNRENEGIFRTL